MSFKKTASPNKHFLPAKYSNSNTFSKSDSSVIYSNEFSSELSQMEGYLLSILRFGYTQLPSYTPAHLQD